MNERNLHLPRRRLLLLAGSGLALASLVIHRRGGDITVTDWHPLTQSFLHENLEANHLGPLPYLPGNWALDDANGASGLGRFDLIVGSDLLYQRHLPEVLAAFIGRHAADGAEVAIVDPGRGLRGRFSGHMQALGFVAPERTQMQAVQASGEAYRGQMLGFHRH